MSLLEPFLWISGGASALLIVLGARSLSWQPLRTARARLDRLNDALLADLDRADLAARQVTRWMLIAGGSGFAVFLALTGSLVLALVATAGAALLPWFFLRRQREAFIARFDEQLPTGLEMLASSARAGLALDQCIAEVGASGPDAVAREFGRISRDIQFGSTTPDALKKARERLASGSFRLATTALLVSIDRGGNLAEALQTIAASLKEIWRLEQKLVTASAEARKAMMIISAIPVFVATVAMIAQPDIAETLTSSLLGLVILTMAMGVYALGIAWTRRLLRADV
jgi:tight adherence protein B